MKLYKGLIKFDKNNKIEDILVLDDNFSWKAFFLNPIWFLFHKMWQEFLLFLLMFGLFNYFADYGIFDFVIQISLIFMVALNSKSWYADFLIKKKKYKIVAMILSNNEIEAKINFIQQINLHNNENNEKYIFSDNLLNPKYFK